MNQEEHIEKLLKFSMKQRERADETQNLYINYIDKLDNEIFSELIVVMDSYCISYIRKQLWRTGCFSKDNESDILQEARIALWKSILKDKENEVIRENFAYYAFGIYRIKAMDLIRKKSKKRKKDGDEISADEPRGETDASILERTESTDESIENEERRNLYDKIIYTYCYSVMNLKTYPPRSLALCYASILPHIKSVYKGEKTIPDTKATSAKWAYEKMEGRTVGDLKEDSEKTLRYEISPKLKWCDDFLQQLEEKAERVESNLLLKDIVYTAFYNKGKIEDWADAVHKTTFKTTVDLIKNDRELLEQVSEYATKESVLYSFTNFTKGGRSR